MSFWDELGDNFSNLAESVTEGAGDWIDGAVENYYSEANAQPEANDAKSENVTFGDGKESPTATVTSTASTPLITGVDNKTLLMGVVGFVALVLVVKG
ncbi:MAG: hypothetical protein OCD00_03060 [Colwellia sp.]